MDWVYERSQVEAVFPIAYQLITNLLFSIIIPLYNKAYFIQRAIDSILNQSYREYEIIVVNDGSTDGSDQIVQGYNQSIKLITQKNQGVSKARNTGIKQASHSYIAFLDGDDFWHPNYLENIYHGIQKYPDTGIIGCSYAQKIDDLGMVDPNSFFLIENYFKRALINTLFFTSATVIKKSFFDHNPGFDVNLARGEDLDVWFRAVLYFGNPVYNFSKLVFYSNEDESQATNRQFPLENSLSFKILKVDSHQVSEKANLDFIKFRQRYVYFNLFPYLLDPKNDKKIKLLLYKLNRSDLLLRWIYMLPFASLRWLLGFSFGKKMIRNYLKFCLRHIYYS